MSDDSKIARPVSTSRRTSMAFTSAVCLLVDTALALHLCGAAAWWWLTPKGFELGTNPFWTNSVLPWLTMIAAADGLIAMHYGRRGLAAIVALAFASTWLAVAVFARWEFPQSFARIWLLILCGGLLGMLLFALLQRGQRRTHRTWLICAAVGASIGWLVVRWQIPPLPSTIPWQTTLADPIGAVTDATLTTQVDVAAFNPARNALSVKYGGLQLTCEPLLEFERVSIDGCWSLLARRSWTPVRRFRRTTSRPTSTLYHYSDGSTVELLDQTESAVTQLTALTCVREATYSHLNSYCYVEIAGHESPALVFSAAPGAPVDVLPADYPFGRPARFAYVDADERFHVCEASSAEKGPFHTLASGRLERGAPLSFAFLNAGRPAFSITLEDWSAQLSDAISPSAGWGVPVNSIEFQRFADTPNSPIGIWITLAATSVGRGFETVGHTAGTYRNRLTIRAMGVKDARP